MNDRQLEQYSCSIFLDEIGLDGQAKLLKSKILIIGAGGLASSSLINLSSVGIGQLGIVDFDKISLSNLPRQILFNQNDLDQNKTAVVFNKLKDKNIDTKIKIYDLKIDENNIEEIIKDYDLVLDCVDNFKTKFVINDACRKLNIPLVCGGVSGFKGQVMMVTNKSKHDFKSLFSIYPNPSKEEIEKDRGVFPLAVSIVSNIECAEALKFLLGIGEPLIDKMLVIDTIEMKFEKFIL